LHKIETDNMAKKVWGFNLSKIIIFILAFSICAQTNAKIPTSRLQNKKSLSPMLGKASTESSESVGASEVDPSESSSLLKGLNDKWHLYNVTIGSESINRNIKSFSKESINIGLVVLIMELLYPLIIEFTDNMGKLIADGTTHLVNTSIDTARRLPGVMKLFFCEKVLNENIPFLALRDDELKNDTDISSGEVCYRPVVLTRSGQALLFFLSTIVEFNDRR